MANFGVIRTAQDEGQRTIGWTNPKPTVVVPVVKPAVTGGATMFKQLVEVLGPGAMKNGLKALKANPKGWRK